MIALLIALALQGPPRHAVPATKHQRDLTYMRRMMQPPRSCIFDENGMVCPLPAP